MSPLNVIFQSYSQTVDQQYLFGLSGVGADICGKVFLKMPSYYIKYYF